MAGVGRCSPEARVHAASDGIPNVDGRSEGADCLEASVRIHMDDLALSIAKVGSITIFIPDV